MVSNLRFGGGALWVCRGQGGSFSASGSWVWDWVGLSEGAGGWFAAQCPGVGKPHHIGHTLRFRVGLPWPNRSLGSEQKRIASSFTPKGLKTCDAGRRRATLCCMGWGGEGVAGLTRRWSGRVCPSVCSGWGELTGESRVPPKARQLTQLGCYFLSLENRG